MSVGATASASATVSPNPVTESLDTKGPDMGPRHVVLIGNLSAAILRYSAEEIYRLGTSAGRTPCL